VRALVAGARLMAPTMGGGELHVQTGVLVGPQVRGRSGLGKKRHGEGDGQDDHGARHDDLLVEYGTDCCKLRASP
jgi:hypothetical protein